jgi:hypothetical protein
VRSCGYMRNQTRDAHARTRRECELNCEPEEGAVRLEGQLLLVRAVTVTWTVTHHGGGERAHTWMSWAQTQSRRQHSATTTRGNHRRHRPAPAVGGEIVTCQRARPMQASQSRAHCHVTDLLDEYGHPHARYTCHVMPGSGLEIV